MIVNELIQPWPQEVVIYTDGASRGNPGPASFGFTVQSSDQQTVYEQADTLGSQTNNYAEYYAVLQAFKVAAENQVKQVTLKSDSQLLIRQLTGEYKVKSEALRPLFEQCKSLAQQFELANYEHVRREFNKRADELANMALDQ